MTIAAAPAERFGQMSFVNKLVFTAKLCVFLATFGFAFPTLLSA